MQLAAVAAVSVLVGHWVGYVVAVPHAGVRDTLLLNSGHTYWMLAVKLALLLGVASLAASGFDALRRGLSGAAGRAGWGLSRGIVALALTQVASFTMLEVGERMLAGEPLAGLVHHNVFFWGVAAQLFIAPLGGLVLTWLGRVFRRVAAIVAATRLPRPRATAINWPSLDLYVPSPDWRGTYSTRGPPASTS